MSTCTTTVRERLATVTNSLRDRYVDREDFIHGLTLAALSGQHIFVLGPPGVGKTEIVEDFCECIEGRVFDRTLMKTTTVDELFGPTNVKSYREDGIYERVTKNMAPEAHVLSLDEVWKGGSATLNSLLRLLSQRKYVQGVEWKDSPLLFAVGSSNELPQDEALRAMYSRFQLRYVVDQVRSRSGLNKILWGQRPDLTETRVSIEDIHSAQAEIASIPFSREAKAAFHEIVEALREAGVSPDTRKLVALVSARGSVVQAEAWLRGDSSVRPEHLTVLAHALWDTPRQIESVNEVVAKYAVTDGEKIIAEANDICEFFSAVESSSPPGKTYGAPDYMELLRRSSNVLNEIAESNVSVPESTRARLHECRERCALRYIQTSTAINADYNKGS